MVDQTDRHGLDTYSYGETWDDAGGGSQPDGHNDTVRFVDDHTAAVVSKTGDYTAANYEVVLVDASGGAVTVTLPDPADDVTAWVKKTDSSSNAVTVATPGSETIDGQSSLSITNQYTSRTVVSDGSDYFIV